MQPQRLHNKSRSSRSSMVSNRRGVLKRSTATARSSRVRLAALALLDGSWITSDAGNRRQRPSQSTGRMMADGLRRRLRIEHHFNRNCMLAYMLESSFHATCTGGRRPPKSIADADLDFQQVRPGFKLHFYLNRSIGIVRATFRHSGLSSRTQIQHGVARAERFTGQIPHDGGNNSKRGCMLLELLQGHKPASLLACLPGNSRGISAWTNTERIGS